MTTQYGYNSRYLTRDGTPWFPIMGEIHYSRYPRAYWKESLYKMKAGGVNIVSSYVIWLHHEEVEGHYDFSGRRDLRAFVQTCAECGLAFFIRVGPWCHGEVRNGGFPDWMLQKNFEPRTNDEAYFAQVRRYFAEIYRQVQGLLLKDGGPIIGMQIENEYGHVGGLQGEEGERHMRRLTEIAKEVGFDLPLYTATGWGGAITGGLLPVMGGYCEAPWDNRTTELEPSVNYVFSHERNDHGIACDHGVGATITFNPASFPYLTAELGGGLQVTHHRRPIAAAADIGAMSLAKLGSGVNLLGYYMYHGGTNPCGKLSTLQESRATGYPNDLPELSYDFRAPVREYGQVGDTLREIKLLAMFAHDFGAELCGMPAYIPPENPENPENLTALRSSVRHNGKSGFVFVNNYQRRYPMAAHPQQVLRAQTESGAVEFPPVNIQDGDYLFFPFNMPVGDSVLATALATPLCHLNAGQPDEKLVFYTHLQDPQYRFAGGQPAAMPLTLTRRQALDAWKVKLDREYLIISENPVVERDGGYEMTGSADFRFLMYPQPQGGFEGFARLPDQGEFAVFEKTVEWPALAVNVTEAPPAEAGQKRFRLDLRMDGSLNDCFLRLDYAGDRAKALIGGEVVADHFYTGETWEIGLKRFGMACQLEIVVEELPDGAEIYLQKWPESKNGAACALLGAQLRPEHRETLFYTAEK